MKLAELGSKDIGIDLGTANIIMTLKGKGIVYEEPAAIAIDEQTEKVIAIGNEAKEMIGRTPNNIKAIRPVQKGVIADLTATQRMLKVMLQKVCQRYKAGKPRVVVGVPSGITEVEERAVEEAVIQAGAREVYLIEEPMAAAVGVGLEISEPTGNIIVDIGGGTTEVAVISLGGIVICNSLRIAGDQLDQDIIHYVKREMNLAIGEITAEEIKTHLGCALPQKTESSMEIRGRNLMTGLPEVMQISSNQVQYAMSESIQKIVEVIKQTLEKTPPELASDLMERGIMLTGGGALIQDFDKLLAYATEIPVVVAENPLECVAKGAEKTLENIEKLRTILTNSRKAK